MDFLLINFSIESGPRIPYSRNLLPTDTPCRHFQLYSIELPPAPVGVLPSRGDAQQGEAEQGGAEGERAVQDDAEAARREPLLRAHPVQVPPDTLRGLQADLRPGRLS